MPEVQAAALKYPDPDSLQNSPQGASYFSASKCGKENKNGRQSIPHEVVRSTNIFFIVYMLIFASSIFLIAFDDFNLITNFTAVAATFNNIGPGLELVGPTGNFGMFSWFSKLILTFDMLAGRLEIFPVTDIVCKGYMEEILKIFW